MHIWHRCVIWETSVLQSCSVWPFARNWLRCLITIASQSTCCVQMCVSSTHAHALLLLFAASSSSCRLYPRGQVAMSIAGAALKKAHCSGFHSKESFLCCVQSLLAVACSTEEVSVGDLNKLFGLKKSITLLCFVSHSPRSIKTGVLPWWCLSSGDSYQEMKAKTVNF